MEIGSPLPELGPMTDHCPVSENPELWAWDGQNYDFILLFILFILFPFSSVLGRIWDFVHTGEEL